VHRGGALTNVSVADPHDISESEEGAERRMMKLWLETYSKSTPVTSSAVLSVVTHTVLIGAAVFATATTSLENRVPSETSLVRLLLPPDRAAGQLPQPEMVKFVAISVPTVGSVTVPTQTPAEIKPAEEVVAGRDERDALALPELPGADSVFLIVDVDSAASRYAWSAAPVFPPRMLEQKTSGFVRAEWVVSADGYADTTTLRILEASNEDFAKAVRDALPFMRFSPAKIGRKAVSQLVQQEFTFRITIAAPDTTKPVMPTR
jgi:hypothetical protein